VTYKSWCEERKETIVAYSSDGRKRKRTEEPGKVEQSHYILRGTNRDKQR